MRKMTYTQAATCGENLKARVTPEQYKKLKFAWFNVGKKWFIEDVDIFGDCEVRFLYLGRVIEWGQSKDIFESDSYEEIELIDEPQHEPEYTIDELINMRGVYFWVNDEQSKEFKQKWKGKNNLSEGCNYYIIITEQGYLAWESESLKHHITESLVKIKPVIQKSEPQHDFASQQDVWAWLSQGKNQVKNNDGNIVGFKDGVFWDFTENRKGYWQFFDFKNWQKYTSTHLIRLNGVEVPAPVDSLDGLDFVYIPNLLVPLDPIQVRASFAITNCYSLDLCYATKEDAIKRAEAMLKFEVVE